MYGLNTSYAQCICALPQSYIAIDANDISINCDVILSLLLLFGFVYIITYGDRKTFPSMQTDCDRTCKKSDLIQIAKYSIIHFDT